MGRKDLKSKTVHSLSRETVLVGSADNYGDDEEEHESDDNTSEDEDSFYLPTGILFRFI